MGEDVLSKGNDDGTALGQSASDKISIYGGGTPVVQPSTASQAAVTGTVTTTATTTALAVDVAATIVLVNQLRSDLVSLRAIKGSA